MSYHNYLTSRRKFLIVVTGVSSGLIISSLTNLNKNTKADAASGSVNALVTVLSISVVLLVAPTIVKVAAEFLNNTSGKIEGYFKYGLVDSNNGNTVGEGQIYVSLKPGEQTEYSDETKIAVYSAIQNLVIKSLLE